MCRSCNIFSNLRHRVQLHKLVIEDGSHYIAPRFQPVSISDLFSDHLQAIAATNGELVACVAVAPIDVVGYEEAVLGYLALGDRERHRHERVKCHRNTIAL